MDWWQPRLSLGLWHIDHYFHAGPDTMPPDSEDAMAVCFSEWRYLTAQVHWDLTATTTVDDETLERVFVHELMHIHLDEISTRKNTEHEERVATELALSFVFLKRSLLAP